MTAPTATETEFRKFRYTARPLIDDGSSKKPLEGVATARSEFHVASELYERNLVPISIDPAEKTFRDGEILALLRKRKVKPATLAISVRQMATGIKSGVPIIRVIEAASTQTDDAQLSAAFRIVKSDIESGSTLAEALGRHPEIFPSVMANIVRAGETGSFLGESMNHVAESLEFEARIRGQLRGAMIYPAVMIVLAMGVSAFLVTSIIPLFAEMFDDLSGGKAELPLPTRILVFLSDQAGIVGPAIILSIVGLGILYRKFRHTDGFRNVMDPLKMKLPGMGSFFHKVALARFARNLALLIHADVPIVEALELTSGAVGNIRMERAIRAAAVGVTEGRLIADSLRDEPLFPKMVVEMVATGEETSKLPEMLTRTAEDYDRQVDTAAKSLQSLMEPMLTIVVIIVVGFVAVAMFAPYFGIASLVDLDKV